MHGQQNIKTLAYVVNYIFVTFSHYCRYIFIAHDL